MTQHQLDLSFARHERDKGIEKAIKNANRAHDNWGDKVYALLKDFVHRYSGPFLLEDFRASIAGLIPEPPHKRAYGSVAAKAARLGLITRVGYAQVKNVNSHCANASVWRRA